VERVVDVAQDAGGLGEAALAAPGEVGSQVRPLFGASTRQKSRSLFPVREGVA
jgi:hypothetical protein